MLPEFDTIYVVYAAAAITGIMIAESVYLLLSGHQDQRRSINRRLRLQDGKLTQKDVLLQLRKERGSFGTPHAAVLSLDWLRMLRAQSGLVMPITRFVALCALIATAIGVGGWVVGVPLLWCVVAIPMLTAALPVVILRTRRKRRHKLFGTQLPEALELITRSLKAGHPVPVAIAMVAREMPDPIGTEFGIVADEITYGSDLVSALTSMYERVGHEDLPLFVTAVSIQATTGGNLREILDGLSATIRERGKLRRKIRAISTEGRMSAYILTAVPVLLFVGILFINPGYYEAVLDRNLTWYLLGMAVFWVGVGNVAMFKLSNFRI